MSGGILNESKLVEVLPELGVEVFRGNGKEFGDSGVEGGDGTWVVICFQEETVEGTGFQAFGVMSKAEADVEIMLEELSKLLGLSPEAVPDPGLTGAVFQAQDIIKGFYAVQDEWTMELLTEGNLCLEGSQLAFIRRVTETVKSTFTYEERRILFQAVFEDGEFRRPVLSEVPRM